MEKLRTKYILFLVGYLLSKCLYLDYQIEEARMALRCVYLYGMKSHIIYRCNQSNIKK